MQTFFELIEKNPPCLRCGKPAKYKFRRRRLLFNYECSLCFKCLRKILNETNDFIWRESTEEEEDFDES